MKNNDNRKEPVVHLDRKDSQATLEGKAILALVDYLAELEVRVNEASQGHPAPGLKTRYYYFVLNNHLNVFLFHQN